MRVANLVSGVVLIVFGLVMLLLVIPVQIEEGPPGMMSPRLVPQMMMGLVVLLSIGLVATNLRPGGPEDDGIPPISRDEVMAALKIGAVFVLALVLFLTVNPLFAGIALILGALLVLGERRPLVLILMPLGLLGGTYLLFYRVLGTAIM